MAADSICTPKLVNLKHTLTPSVSTVKYGPFRATQIWNEAIDNLKTHIELKRKRMKMKWHDQCFSGTDAVDVVFQHLQREQEFMQNKDISREKAVKLCQLMLENHIFETVHQKPLKEEAKENARCLQFEDSSTKLYRFLEDVAKENLYSRDTPDCSTNCDAYEHEQFIDKYSINREVEQDSILEDGVICNSLALGKQDHFTQELMDITGGQWRKYSMSSLKKMMVTPAKLFKKTPSKKEDRDDCYSQRMGRTPIAQGRVSQIVEEEIWREVALASLLTLVDITLLDQILSYEHTAEKSMTTGGQPGLSFSNLAFRRYESVASLLSDSSSIKSEEDLWMDSALDCLECLPNGIEILDQSRSEETDMTQRLRLFQSIADYYNSLPEPLWSEKFVDLHVALYNLLMQFKRHEVLKALQLSVILLPVGIREELVRLLLFMKFACEDHLNLSSNDDNRSVIEKTFSNCVIRNKVLAPHQCGQLVLFMMDHAGKLNQCPEDVENQVLARVEEITHGQIVEVKREVTFCTRVSEEEYKKQSKELTERLLVDLINSIIDDTQIPLKDKKLKLKLFHKHHTTLFEKHFSNLL